ncbi:MAG: AbrB/MazE/SpoVT family DNA-binding domain-containing protein [Candidatus Heimdallarchaeota archaeon]
MSHVIEYDKKGRMVIPKEIRDKIKTNRFLVELFEGEIRLVPIPPVDSLRGKYRLEKSIEEIEEDQEKFLKELAHENHSN